VRLIRIQTDLGVQDISDSEARELAERLRRHDAAVGEAVELLADAEGSAALDLVEAPLASALARLELALDAEDERPSVIPTAEEAQAMYEELNAWRIEEPLEGWSERLDALWSALRDAPKREVSDPAVVFEVDGQFFTLDAARATTLAEELRRAAAGQLGEDGYEAGARAVADAIEERLVGWTESPVALEGDAAEAVFYYLNVMASPSGPEHALYTAVRAVHYGLQED
jgi:hypothetical protein